VLASAGCRCIDRSLSLRTGGQRQVLPVPVDALRRRNVMLSAD
jgi:hypothetical protein